MRQFLQRNAWLKFVSLVVAYLTWALVVDRPPMTRLLTVPFTIGDVAEDVIVIGYDPEDVRIQLEGDDSAFTQLDGVHAVLDVSNLAPGSHTIPVRKENIRDVPYGVDLEVMTGRVQVTIEKRHSKMVGVRPIAVGSPVEGFEVRSMKVVPTTVDVSGPAPVIESLSPLEARIDLNGRSQSFETDYALQPPSGDIRLNVDVVQVTVEIAETPVTETLELDVSSTLDGFELDPAKVGVDITAPPSVLASARRLIVASVTPQLGPRDRQGEASVEIQFPGLSPSLQSQIQVVGVQPQTLTVRRPGR